MKKGGQIVEGGKGEGVSRNRQGFIVRKRTNDLTLQKKKKRKKNSPGGKSKKKKRESQLFGRKRYFKTGRSKHTLNNFWGERKRSFSRSSKKSRHSTPEREKGE